MNINVVYTTNCTKEFLHRYSPVHKTEDRGKNKTRLTIQDLEKKKKKLESEQKPVHALFLFQLSDHTSCLASVITTLIAIIVE